MFALSEALPFLVYLTLGAFCFLFLIAVFLVKRWYKIIAIACLVLCSYFLIRFKLYNDESERKSQLDHVGIYYLSKYPNCDSCYIQLNENMKYKVFKRGQEIEQGDWHYESGSDYWITYLNGERDQLGFGIYTYTNYRLGYPK